MKISVGKAIWFIESHIDENFDLDKVANVAGVSKFHLVRAFKSHSGQSVMSYVRTRRLSEAAKRLVEENIGILDVALLAGYNSHEAFTRAFGRQFGISPDKIRKARNLEYLDLTEPLEMNNYHKNMRKSVVCNAGTVTKGPFIIVGLRQRYSEASKAKMPMQWQSFAPHIGHIERHSGNTAYGVLCNGDGEGNIDYLTGVEVDYFSETSNDLECIRVAAQTYVVFSHEGHVSEIGRTWQAIYQEWLPQAKFEIADAPQIEKYGEEFDPEKGVGDIEIWVPVNG